MNLFDVDGIPELYPLVEEKLVDCLKKEVAAYAKIVHGTKCLLCPFRKFCRERYLIAHLKYHSEENMYMADGRSPQGRVIRAYFDYCQAVSPVAEGIIDKYLE